MAHWLTTNLIFKSFLSDRVGYKSGLALTSDNMASLLDRKDPLLVHIKNENEEIVRISTDDIEDTFQNLLYRLGVIKHPFVGHAPTLLKFDFIHDPEKSLLLINI